VSRGWQEMRLEPDGRWTETGQLHDQFPLGRPVPAGAPPRPFHSVQGIDTTNTVRTLFVEGAARELPVHTLGWAQFRRP
jgi:hypothetical protein